MNKTYDFKFVSFLEGYAVVVVRNATEFKQLKQILNHFNIDWCQNELHRKDIGKLSFYRDIAYINAQRKGEFYMSGPLFFDFSNSKGISFDWNVDRVKGFYDELYNPKELLEELGLIS